ncbi:hypothetical protein [Nocardia sp. MW-W600-9]
MPTSDVPTAARIASACDSLRQVTAVAVTHSPRASAATRIRRITDNTASSTDPPALRGSRSRSTGGRCG